MYCERCECLGQSKDQYGWWFKTCNHPDNKGRFCGELKKMPHKQSNFLVIMDTYKKKYKKALEKAKSMIDDLRKGEDILAVSDLESMFPELKESEDERVRKEIMDFIDTNTIDSDERRNRWLAWLEKYKPISSISLEDTKVKMSLMQYISELNQDVVHLHPGIETCNEWLAWLEKQVEQKPTDWSEEDETNLINTIIMLKEGASHHFTNFSIVPCVDWLKSIKERVLPQPKQEWSEEDEIGLGNALWVIKQAKTIAKDENDMGNIWYAEKWLKSLKDRKI